MTADRPATEAMTEPRTEAETWDKLTTTLRAFAEKRGEWEPVEQALRERDDFHRAEAAQGAAPLACTVSDPHGECLYANGNDKGWRCYRSERAAPRAALRVEYETGRRHGYAEGFRAAPRAEGLDGFWFAQGTLIHGPDRGGIDVGPLIGEARTEASAASLVQAHNAIVRAAPRAEGP